VTIAAGGEVMATVSLEGIQPGWRVVDRDGQEVGTVLGTVDGGIRVKKGGLLSGEVRVPAEAVDEVETGHVELAVRKNELRKA
jgi:hypothetical protein